MTSLDRTAAQAACNQFSSATNQQLDALIGAHLDETFPALVMTVVQGGEVLLNASWGWIDSETWRYPVQTQTRFDLASVSKLFTTTAFLSLVSEGRIALDDPLAQVIPEFAESGPRDLDGGQDPHTREKLPVPDAVRGKVADPALVTFAMLLTHTSGLAPWRNVFDAAGPAPLPPDQVDLVSRAERWKRGLAALCGYPFVGQPGDGIVRYSDLGLMLLGEAAARLHGVPGQLDQVIRERVTEPLGLESITYNPLEHDVERNEIAPTEFDQLWRKRRCWGEVHDENACGLGGIAGHAGVFGTARDVAALGQAWLTESSQLSIDPALITAATQERVRTGEVRRGLGWLLKSLSDSPAGEQFSAASFGHTGFTGTSLWVDPTRELVVAVMTNRVYPGREKPGIHAFRRAVHDIVAQEVDR